MTRIGRCAPVVDNTIVLQQVKRGRKKLCISYANRVLSTNSLGGLVLTLSEESWPPSVQWAGTGAVGRGRWYECRTYYDIPSVVGTTLQIDVPGTAQWSAQAIYVPIK